ncbi:MAG TPA: DM13 domain-containing protein [Actinophytocola sp.]|uniref:DM13 domain-containing protein n=1 Tax=Actinophytocola sp. TaxID=1872138 RepID=UPI002DB70D03|nr:DM13 domain-containing protein [Actinophytocola sp.]HEU5473221.1 DM13 domain-containing protein [Actinophytocola sp.]
MRRLLRRPVTWVVASIALIGLVVGLLLFEPWRAVTSSRVDEALPAASTPEQQAPAPPPAEAQVPQAPPKPQPAAQPVVLAEGQFVSKEHETSGVARVLMLPDGARVLRLENFATSDGPDVHVWLSAAAPAGPDGSFDDGRYVKLGEMKATSGNQNYAIPADADLAGLRSAVIWCDRFNVAFGAAPLSL